MKGSLLKGLSTILLVTTLVVGLALSVNAWQAQPGSDSNGVVYIQQGEKITPVKVSNASTVGEVLKLADISFSKDDTVEPDIESKVKSGDTIKLTIRDYRTYSTTGTVEHEMVYVYSQEVALNEEVILQEGKDGYGTRKFKQTYENGKLVGEEIVWEDLTTPVVDEKVALSHLKEPVSPLDLEWEFNSDKEPLEPVAVYRSQRATAYSAKPGAKTASGRYAQVGHVAVNPNVIPYGSKLFIQSSDGKHVYGYAIAADTGGALLSGLVGVDLYFDTLQECYRFGCKSVDIFVLEVPKAK